MSKIGVREPPGPKFALFMTAVAHTHSHTGMFVSKLGKLKAQGIYDDS